MSTDFFENNRKKVFENIENDSLVILFNGRAPVKRGDEFYLFSPDRNFYYTTGISEEMCIAAFSKIKGKQSTKLYIRRESGGAVKWVGENLGSKEAEEISGICDIKFIDEFKEDISSVIFKNNIENVYLDMEKRDWESAVSPAVIFAGELKGKFPYVNIINIYNIFAALRSVKEKYEINEIRKAINITRLGMESIMKNAKPGAMEYELEANFDYVLKKNGVFHKAFQTITASGKNATILHYTKNNGQARDGDLVLVDAGAQINWYNGDISRTFPVSGKFTLIQKTVYNIVLEGQQKVFDIIKPGVTYARLNEVLKEFYFEKLKGIGLVNQMQDVDRYYYHSVSHPLGLETHDIGRHVDMELTEGMIITVEPGLYIDEYEIGIRIEDDVLVTKDGYENLSQGMIKTVEEIEKFMEW